MNEGLRIEQGGHRTIRDRRLGERGRAGLGVLATAVALLGSLLSWIVPGPLQSAGAFPLSSSESSFVSFTLEACRLTAGTTLPIAGKFVCPDAMYTTGNLGKSWNELDLVPHRLTTSSGTQAGATVDYKVSVAADGITNGKVGYDVISAAEVNTAESDASCTVSSSATSTSGTAGAPFGGGTDTVIYKDLTIHQARGTTCVLDWYQRLALTSHLYSGSSLQSYMFPGANLSGSKKTLSIPVNQIEPQSLAKDMSASQSQDFAWNLSKSASPGAVDFTNSCSVSGRTSANVAVTVSWTRVAADPSVITIFTHVYATNPSARLITTTVTDRIYTGSTQATQVTPTQSVGSLTGLTATVDVPAGQTVKIIDFTGTVPAGTATSFNDVATGTYTDVVTGVNIPQTTTASASALVSTTNGGNNTASISDTESISAGFQFKVTSVSGIAGSFAGGYTLNTSTTGPVVWNSGTVSGNGSVTFNKTITADAAGYVTVADGKALSDTATLTGGGGFSANASATVNLTSGATVSVGVHKNMQGGVTGTQTFRFDLYAGSNPGNTTVGLTKLGTITIPITPPALSGDGSLSAAASGTATTFTIVEQASAPWATQANQVMTVTLPNCSGTSTFNNTFGPATAQVRKVTVPAGNEAGWTFTLTGPGTPALGESVTTTGAGYVGFTTSLEQGSYTITETGQTGFDFTSSSGGCSFTVVYPDNADHNYQCTFTNTQRGSLEVTKTVNWNGVTPDVTQTFTLCITGPTYPSPTLGNGGCQTIGSSGGTLTWNNLLQGNYTVSENAPGSSWVVSGGDGAVAAVSPGLKTTATGITNTRKLGSLQVSKTVDWNGVTPVSSQTFQICITGPSFPTTSDCKSIGSSGGTLTWTNLIPGDYTATETNPGSSWTVAGSPTGTITVPSDGTTAAFVPVITNTRKLGSLQITKSINWNGVSPINGQTFSICIAGPSYPVANCQTFTAPNGLVQSWSNLIPGSYTITESGLGTEWIKSGATSATVPTDGGQGTATVTNTRKLGALQVTKTVNWSGSTPDTSASFSICITGPSYPTTPNCQSIGSSGGALRWGSLIPGAYVVTETNPGSQWTVFVGGSPATVPNDGGHALATVTNTLKPGAARVVKTVSGVAPSGTQAFTFQLRQGATASANGTTLESLTANAGNSGILNFTTVLVPGQTYQMCEQILPAWQTSLGQFVPNSFNPPDGTVANPNVDNSILCGNFVAQAGATMTITVDNTPPPGGRALTIGYWKNWASCAASNGSKKPVLDQTMAMAEANGIVMSAGTGTYPTFGATLWLVLHGSTATPNRAPDCTKAVNLLNKSNFAGKKMASDPAFNLAAQLLAAQLNYTAGAGKTGAATTAINQAVLLLGTYHFDGNGYVGKISAADAATMNQLATILDDYNNNR